MGAASSVRDRQWRLVRLLGAQKRGVTAAQVMEKLGASRATVYRDLEQLERAGFPIARAVVNGETRISLPASDAPGVAATAKQLHALRLARMALTPLAGSWVTREMDAFLRANRPPKEAAPPKTISYRPPRPGGEADVMAALEDAIARERGVRFTYRASSRGGAESARRVDPRKIRALPDGSTYLIAWDVAAKDWRTFKLVRMANVAVERRGWAKHPPLEDFEAKSAKAVKAWAGGAARVRVLLSKDVAFLAQEYALPGQTVEEAPDGGVVVSAEVAGLVEVSRWVLGWGKCARVLEPDALRQSVMDELAQAVKQYG